MWNLETAGRNRFIFSESLDVIAFTLPIVISVVAAPILYATVPPDTIPFLGYVVIVVLSDVAHVWSTLFRTQFDGMENSRRSVLYNTGPVILFIVQTLTHFLVGERWFWTTIGYFAIYHFVKQQYGLLMVAQCRERNFQLITRDKRLLYALSLFPIFLWHCDATRYFDWFNRDDPFVIPQFAHWMTDTILGMVGGVAISPLVLGYVLWLCLWVYFLTLMVGDARECRRRGVPFPVMRTLMLLYAGITWSVGVLYNHKMIALTFLNLYHALPSFIIVFCAAMNRWLYGAQLGGKELRGRSASFRDRFGRLMTGGSTRFPLYLGFLFLLGITEEILWEFFVWRDYIPNDWAWASLWHPDDGVGYHSPVLYSAIVSLLILPQTMHYFLDMYIWKMGKTPANAEENPRLKQFLALAPLS